jgi:glucan phosphoethanolaminetransferase (alkaline phosphatase superfamily)
LGSASEITIEKLRLLAWYHERGYRRQAARPSTRITAPTLAIFIVGESVRADAYGPSQTDRGPASRELAARISGGLGSWLPTTCASSDGTHLSVPLLLTETAPQNRDQAAVAPTVLGILKANGFSTAWLSNNEAGSDAREAGHDLYAGRFEVNPDKVMGASALQTWQFDEDMIPTVKRFVGGLGKPKALILHFIGSHIEYGSRYPRDFFPPEPEELGADARERLRYERSLEYEARTILKVAAILDSASAPAFLVYTSDHGENLHEDHNGVLVHLGPRTTRRDGTVPSFALWNRAMAASGEPARALAKLSGAKEIAHADVATLFLTLAGMRSGPVQPTLDPTIWGRISIGDAYSPVHCSQLKP